MLNAKILTGLETLESLYFFTQSLEFNLERLEWIRAHMSRLNRSERIELLREVEHEIQEVRQHYGAIATNQQFRELLLEARKAQAPPHLSKAYIDRHLFRKYERIFPRWQYVRTHAFAVFDHIDNKRIGWLFELEGTHLRDALYFLNGAAELHKAIHDKGDHSAETRRRYHAYLHGCTAATFSFVESYLNGIAFDCFTLTMTIFNLKITTCSQSGTVRKRGKSTFLLKQRSSNIRASWERC